MNTKKFKLPKNTVSNRFLILALTRDDRKKQRKNGSQRSTIAA